MDTVRDKYGAKLDVYRIGLLRNRVSQNLQGANGKAVWIKGCNARAGADVDGTRQRDGTLTSYRSGAARSRRLERRVQRAHGKGGLHAPPHLSGPIERPKGLVLRTP